MREKAKMILRNKKAFAVIGVTQDQTKYGYEVFHTLKESGYKAYPLNPKYNEIAGTKCYLSLKDLPEKPDVVVLTLSPANVEKIVDGINGSDADIIWMPPGCFSEQAIKKCEAKGVNFIYDVCPVGILLELRGEGGSDSNAIKGATKMKIEVLGPGCVKCEKIYEIVQRTLKEIGKEAEVAKVKDIKSFMQYGILMTPALVINGKVLSSGRVPGLAEIREWLTKEE